MSTVLERTERAQFQQVQHGQHLTYGEALTALVKEYESQGDTPGQAQWCAEQEKSYDGPD